MAGTGCGAQDRLGLPRLAPRRGVEIQSVPNHPEQPQDLHDSFSDSVLKLRMGFELAAVQNSSVPVLGNRGFCRRCSQFAAFAPCISKPEPDRSHPELTCDSKRALIDSCDN
jgi:hypothetical protein